MVMFGGGVIGIEWASFLHDVGVNVTLVEAEDRILPTFDKEIVLALKQTLKKRGVEVIEQATIDPTSIEIDHKVSLVYEKEDKKHTLTADKLLLSIGRKANTANIGIENTEIELDDKRFIKVNENYQTKETHIYAIGDVIGGRQLAHVATYEGKKAIEHLTEQNSSEMKGTEILTCIYGNPEIAMVGMTEEEANNEGLNIKKEKITFPAIGKAHVNGNTDGFVKIIIDEENDDIIGIHMIGSNVTELIGQASMAKYFDSS